MKCNNFTIWWGYFFVLNRVINKHLAEVDVRAQSMRNDLIKNFAEQEGLNEILKEQNQMEWVGRMNNIRNRAEDVVRKETFG